MAQDRFYGWADPKLYDEVKLAAAQHQFERELGFELFHHGATDSYKQKQFGEANVQLTFHANETKTIDGVECIKMEPDIDYFNDPLAHALLEVLVNGISGSLTDPRQVYVLRWIAGRHAGGPAFNPPYVIAYPSCQPSGSRPSSDSTSTPKSVPFPASRSTSPTCRSFR